MIKTINYGSKPDLLSHWQLSPCLIYRVAVNTKVMCFCIYCKPVNLKNLQHDPKKLPVILWCWLWRQSHRLMQENRVGPRGRSDDRSGDCAQSSRTYRLYSGNMLEHTAGSPRDSSWNTYRGDRFAYRKTQALVTRTHRRKLNIPVQWLLDPKRPWFLFLFWGFFFVVVIIRNLWQFQKFT